MGEPKEMTARDIAQCINEHARECLICGKPDYDVVDRGRFLIRTLVQAETERCARLVENPLAALLSPREVAAAIREGEKDE